MREPVLAQAPRLEQESSRELALAWSSSPLPERLCLAQALEYWPGWS